MAMEATAQVKLEVSAERIWKAMAKDYLHVFPKVMSDTMENIEIIAGDGGVGSVLLIQLSSRLSMATQKEKIVELDEATYTFGLEVMEGGVMLKKGYSSFKTSFKLKPEGDEETLVDVKTVFGLDGDGDDDRQLEFKENATKPALGFLLRLEKFILQNS